MASTAAFHEFFKNIKRPLLIGHRGFSGLYPENTMLSFEKAVEFQADMLELDVHMTKDEELIVSHDVNPSRCTNKTEGVENKIWNDYTLEEIKTWDAGYHFTSAHYDTKYPFRGQGIQIPTLKEVLQRFPDSYVNIDMKHHVPRVAQRLSEVLGECNAKHRVIVCSMKGDMLKVFKQIEPTMPLGAGPGEVVKFYSWNKFGLSKYHTRFADVFEIPDAKLLKKFSGWSIGSNLNEPSFIQHAHSLGQKVFHWWANTEEDIGHLLDIGSDGVMTDMVDIGLKVFKERGYK